MIKFMIKLLPHAASSSSLRKKCLTELSLTLEKLLEIAQAI